MKTKFKTNIIIGSVLFVFISSALETGCLYMKYYALCMHFWKCSSSVRNLAPYYHRLPQVKKLFGIAKKPNLLKMLIRLRRHHCLSRLAGESQSTQL